MNKLIHINTLFTSARMGIGATTIPYLLSVGITLPQIATIKIIQAIVIFFGEIPTGLIADYFGRKVSLSLSAICAIISFLLFYFGSHYITYVIAEIFNALTICFFSGAFEALLIDNNKELKNNQNALGQVFSKIGIYGALATMFTGLLGGHLGKIDLRYPFVFSTLIMTVTLMMILVIRENKVVTEKKERNLYYFFQGQIQEIFKTKSLYVFFIIYALVQFSLQPVLHYWQPYFKDLDNLMTADTYGNIFFLYVFTHFIFSLFTKKILSLNIFKHHHLILIFGIILMSSFTMMFLADRFSFAIISFLSMQGCMNSFRTLLSASLNTKIQSVNRASVLSSVSFISRLGMIVSLIFIGIILNFYTVSSLYLISALSILCILLLMASFKKKTGLQNKSFKGL